MKKAIDNKIFGKQLEYWYFLEFGTYFLFLLKGISIWKLKKKGGQDGLGPCYGLNGTYDNMG